MDEPHRRPDCSALWFLSESYPGGVCEPCAKLVYTYIKEKPSQANGYYRTITKAKPVRKKSKKVFYFERGNRMLVVTSGSFAREHTVSKYLG